MSRLICSALLCAAFTACGTRGPEGPPGPEGPQGPAGPGVMTGPSISSVVPAAVTQGSEYDVTISGFATAWTDASTVGFGAGITVTRVKAASPTSLLVHVRVAPDATPDVREVSVTQGDQTVRWVSAFSVLPRVKFSALGTASQVSLSVVRLEVNEPAFEFDTSTQNGFHTGVEVTTTPRLPVVVHQLSDKVLDVLVLTDADAGTGAYDVNVVSRAGSLAERKFTATQVVTVTPLQKTELVDGVPANGMIDRPFQSATYRYRPTPPDAGLVNPVVINLTSSNTAVAPKVALVSSSGVWPSNVPFATTHVLTPIPGDFVYLVVWEASGGSGFSYTLATVPVTRTTEEEPNEVFGQARQLSVPAVFGPAQLGSLTDVDWVKISAAAGDMGKRIHVVTKPGDLDTDTVVEVFATDGTTSFGGESNDFDFHEDHLSPVISVAGDYYVKVSMSSAVDTYDAAESHYDLVITLE